MLRNVLSVMSLTALVVLAGCIKSKTVVTVEKDGSGTVKQIVYSKELAPSMAGLESPSADEQLAAARAKAAQTAQSMGEGVTLQAVEQLPSRDGWKGMQIVYAFPDISKVSVDPLPEFSLGGFEMGVQVPGMDGFPPGGAGPGGLPIPQDKGEQVRFDFTREPTPKLTIVTPPMTPPAEAGPPEAGQDQQGQAMANAMMAQFLDGMLMEFQVRVGGKITDTNATYVSTSREVVGLLRMDLGALIKDPAGLDKMMSMQKATAREEVKEQLQDPDIAKHIKMETKEQVEVTFE